jgi:transmembrane sensor
MVERESADDIEDAACRWLWRLDREGRSPALDAELRAWLSEDPRREGAFLKAESVWILLDRARWPADSQSQAARKAPSSLPRRAMLAGGSAAIAASLGAAGVWVLSADRIQTRVGEVRRLPLQDGSTAAINTASALEVVYQPKTRIIRLKAGEAWFQVAKDARRPFIVEAGRIRVRAVGTAFSVRVHPDGVDVLVTEGVVEAWAEGAEGAAVRMAAGDKAYLGDNAAVHEAIAAPSEIDRKLAWRDGKIDLAGETLGEAVSEFNRYNERHLVIQDQSLADQPLFGVFNSDDPEGFAKAVAAALSAKISTTSAQISIFRERSS